MAIPQTGKHASKTGWTGSKVWALERHFLVRFAGVALVLHLIVGSFALIAYAIDRTSSYEGRRVEAERHERIEVAGRTAPVGDVITDAAARAAAPAQRTALSGDAVVAQACASCHQHGLLDAPRIGDTGAWQQRLAAEGGVEGLQRSAIRGKNAMPPKGGRADLTEREITEALRLMLERSGVN